MITKKQSKKRRLEDDLAKARLNKPKIESEIAQLLEDFLQHKPYLEFFKDLAGAVAKKDFSKVTDVQELLPYMFTAIERDGQNLITFVSEEQTKLFKLYQISRLVLKDASVGLVDKAMAEGILRESDVETLHKHIKQFVEPEKMDKTKET